MSEDTYKGLDPNISDAYIETQFYAGMEKLSSYLTKQAAFDEWVSEGSLYDALR